jgi:predicted RNA-binding Zn-ribbon protein involved in translation (DUF1610 family)
VSYRPRKHAAALSCVFCGWRVRRMQLRRLRYEADGWPVWTFRMSCPECPGEVIFQVAGWRSHD